MNPTALHAPLRERQAAAGDIVLLYGDASEALTQPYLAATERINDGEY
jgi:hypothetical protein